MSEKGLAEKVMFCIHIDSKEEVVKRYRDYIDHVELLGKKADNDLLIKTNVNYTEYMVKKAKEIKNE